MSISAPKELHPRRLAHSEAGSSAVRLLLTLSFVVAAHGVSLGLYYGLGVDRLQAIFLLPVLAAAIGFGVWYGFIAAVTAVAAYGYLVDPSQFAWRLDAKQDLLNLVLYVGAAWIAGVYTEAVRRRQGAARRLLEAGETLSAHADGHALGRFVRAVAEQSADGWRPRLAQELRRAAGSAAVALTGVALAVLARHGHSPSLCAAALLGAVIVAGGLFGVRFGFLTALAAAMAHGVLAAGDPRLLQLGTLEDVLVAAAFCALGGWVGALSDRMRDERQAMRSLLRTGPSLAVAAEEPALRTILFDALAASLRAPSIRLCDETGTICHDRIAGAQPPSVAIDQLPANETVQIGPWRMRRMCVESRDVGVLTWKSSVSKSNETRSIDEVIAAIADLGASAIARSRLTVEKAEMEFVARTEQLRTILLDAVSHHFRTPLTSIMGAATSLLEQDGQHAVQARRDFLLIIKEQAHRLNRYVENFLSVARLESGSIVIRPEEILLEPFLYDVWETFGEAGGAKRFFDVQMEDVTVLADPAPLKQVLGNILENAIKFSSEGSEVSVRSYVQGHFVVLEVSDEGPGVAENDLERIFERFYRSARANAPGLGLGLYITKSLVELMGGAIEARRRTDRPGLVMSISLPLARSSH